MISTADVATELVNTLNAHAALTGEVGDEIREENWMGTDYEYPCVRFHVTRVAPIGQPGSCEDTGFVCEFNASYRTATPSSKPTADGLKVVIEALVNQKLSMAGVFVARTGIVLQDAPGPIPESENAWMARAFFNCRLQEI